MVQDEVVGKIVSALADALPATRSPPRRRTTSLEAYDLFVRGRSLALQSPQAARAARSLLQRAIALDPDFAEAYAELALSHHSGCLYYGEPPEEHRPLARSMAQQAVSLDPNNVDAHLTLGYLRAYDGELADGVAEYEKGLHINPNHDGGWNILAALRVLEGRAGRGN